MNKILTRIEQIAKNEGITIGALEREIGTSKGVLSRAINNGTDIQSKWLQILVEKYPQYSTRWLMSGEGNMMDNDGKQLTTNNIKEGALYYNVDFLGGFDEVFNDQTVNPELSITNGICPRAQLWCNITGHSMEPTISNGDIIALRQCSVQDIQYGEIYAVVMDSFRTVKMLRRSDTPGMIRFVPVNTADFDPQDFPVKRILKIYEVVGCLRRFF